MNSIHKKKKLPQNKEGTKREKKHSSDCEKATEVEILDLAVLLYRRSTEKFNAGRQGKGREGELRRERRIGDI